MKHLGGEDQMGKFLEYMSRVADLADETGILVTEIDRFARLCAGNSGCEVDSDGWTVYRSDGLCSCENGPAIS